jgi:hypothetical protein
MRKIQYGTKIITIVAAVVIMGALMVNFDSIFTDLNCNALAVSSSTKADDTQLPSTINYLDNDKMTFISYCSDIYGNDLPLQIDESIYHYYGTVNGYRLYRLQPLYVSYDNINQQQVIGGYTFESPCLYRPYRMGLYAIGDDKVYTLEEAYNFGLVDISKVYKLYSAKSGN